VIRALCSVWVALSLLLGVAVVGSAEGGAEATKTRQVRKDKKLNGKLEKAGSEKKSGTGGLFADDNEPIIITSDRMELDRKKSTVTYRGNVLTVRGDLKMRSDTLSGVIDFEGQGLKKIVAAGNVRVTQEGRTATGDEAIFDSEKDTITLLGNPVIQQGNSKISGDRVIVYLKEDRGVVEGGSQRVKAVIFPGELSNGNRSNRNSNSN
jgi:lipopolysaccharide export system protein LptA